MSNAADTIRRLTGFLDHPSILSGLLVAGLVFAVWQGVAAGRDSAAVYDAHSYWLAGGSEDPYASTITSGFDDSVNPFKYRYPPPLAQVFAVLHLVPWPIVAGLWVGLSFAVFLILAGRWALLLIFFPPVLGELWYGNINLLIALAIVLAIRRPAAWAFVLLTKITPGIGLLWFAARREWRALGVAIGATMAVAAVFLVLAPHLWFEFIDAMTVQTYAAIDVPPLALQIALPYRLVAAAWLVVFAARVDRPWLVAVAATMAAPALWLNVYAILLAAVPLAEGRGLDRPLIWLPRRRIAGGSDD